MASGFFWFLFGILLTLAAIFIGGYIYLAVGEVSMATAAPPFPLEESVAHLALQASYRNMAGVANPLPENEANMMAGAVLFKNDCAGCHGRPGKPSLIAARMSPRPPQLFESQQMVTDDPEGITYWKVTNGIRLSAMPSFLDVISEKQRWQLTMLLTHADKLSPAVRASLSR